MRVKVRVSATSANIGAGFDCMGLALGLYNEIEAETWDKPLIEPCGDFPTDPTNLVFRSMNEVFRRFSAPPNVRLIQRADIPAASGLGSSAACIVGGCLAANALLGSPLSEHELVNLCSVLDGHPDNVVPAIKGGICAGVLENGRVEYIKCCAPKKLVLAVATPDFGLKTEFSRSVLPAAYTREDVVFSLQRAVTTFAALVSGDTDMLKVVDDRLHQPYRRPLIKGYNEIESAMKSAGAISVYLSGAGPTLIGFFKQQRPLTLLEGWTLRWLSVDNEGAEIVCGQPAYR